MSFLSPRASYRWIILGCCVLAYAVSFLVRWSYTGLAPYIREDLGLDKAALGLLGGAFFYPYALAQVPWGWMADRYGGRYVVACGVMLSAVGLACFATATNLWVAVAWRMALGIVAATAFVPIASLLAHWFSQRERGFANGIYYGLGGGLGQGTAFLLLPMLSVYVLHDSIFPITGWRGSMILIACVVGGVGILCLVVLRSYPPLQYDSGADRTSIFIEQKTETYVFFYSVFKDPIFWLLGVYFSLSLVALRLVPAWISLYANDVFFHVWNYDRDAAVVAGGTIGTLYTVGHIVGSPFLGKLSDWLMKFGIQRLFLPSICLGMGGLIVSLFLVSSPQPWLLGMVAVFLGILFHAFPIINATVSERWGVTTTGRYLGSINMIGQFSGALALSASGYVGMMFSNSAGGLLSEYQGIWSGVMGCGILGAICGGIAYRIMSRQ